MKLKDILGVLAVIFIMFTAFTIFVFLGGCESIYDQGFLFHYIAVIAIEIIICKYCIRYIKKYS